MRQARRVITIIRLWNFEKKASNFVPLAPSLLDERKISIFAPLAPRLLYPVKRRYFPQFWNFRADCEDVHPVEASPQFERFDANCGLREAILIFPQFERFGANCGLRKRIGTFPQFWRFIPNCEKKIQILTPVGAVFALQKSFSNLAVLAPLLLYKKKFSKFPLWRRFCFNLSNTKKNFIKRSFGAYFASNRVEWDNFRL